MDEVVKIPNEQNADELMGKATDEKMIEERLSPMEAADQQGQSSGNLDVTSFPSKIEEDESSVTLPPTAEEASATAPEAGKSQAILLEDLPQYEDDRSYNEEETRHIQEIAGVQESLPPSKGFTPDPKGKWSFSGFD